MCGFSYENWRSPIQIAATRYQWSESAKLQVPEAGRFSILTLIIGKQENNGIIYGYLYIYIMYKYIMYKYIYI